MESLGEEVEIIALPRPRSRLATVFAPQRRVVRIYRHGSAVALESAEFPQPTPAVLSHLDVPGGEEPVDDPESS
ncbi:MAG: hypothetical protein R6U92_04550 [Bacillota bacterium]